MKKTYLGFNIADSMFDGPVSLQRIPLTEEQLKEIVSDPGIISCLNKSHPATVRALKTRLGISVEIPEQPQHINLGVGDSIVIISLRGLPRHTTRYQYTDEEVARARFAFSRWTRIG